MEASGAQCSALAIRHDQYACAKHRTTANAKYVCTTWLLETVDPVPIPQMRVLILEHLELSTLYQFRITITAK